MSYHQTVNNASYYCLLNLSQINLYAVHRAVRHMNIKKLISVEHNRSHFSLQLIQVSANFKSSISY